VKVYVASSWRNTRQQCVVECIRQAGHDVYDFRNPREGNHGFHWSAIDPEWKAWSPEAFVSALGHPVAESGFGLDMQALRECDVCVLVLPCGRSAHLEAGWAAGAGKKLLVLLSEGEPELMYKIADKLFCTLDELLEWFWDRCPRKVPRFGNQVETPVGAELDGFSSDEGGID
jgi:hypothetical protein